MNADEQALVASYLRARDEDAFRRLYRHCSPRLYLLALRLTGGRAHDADDVLQETWIRACASLSRFRWESRLHTWLAGIVVNCWRETRRAVVVMHDIEGYTHEEIAAALLIAPGTSKHQLARAHTRVHARAVSEQWSNVSPRCRAGG